MKEALQELGRLMQSIVWAVLFSGLIWSAIFTAHTFGLITIN